MSIYVTSDTHFGHSNIIDYCCRPFDNIKVQDDTMRDRWNAEVMPDDMVYHLGDFSFMNNAKASKMLNSLNGIKVLIKGNHDRCDASMLNLGFAHVLPYTTMDNMFIMVHNPDNSIINHGDNRSKIILAGHHHEENRAPANKGGRRYINVSVDAWGFRPASLIEIMALVKNYKKDNKINEFFQAK